MIVKVGNQSFDSRQVPIAIVMDDQDLIAIGGIRMKHDTPTAPRSLYVRTPIDMLEHQAVLMSWLTEAISEMPLPPAFKATNPGAPRTDQ